MKALPFTIAGWLALAGAAAADSAVTTAIVNLRNGPGTDHAVLARVPAGARVEIIDCGGGWCEAEWDGRAGFVNESFLDREAGLPTRAGSWQPGNALTEWGEPFPIYREEPARPAQAAVPHGAGVYGLAGTPEPAREPVTTGSIARPPDGLAAGRPAPARPAQATRSDKGQPRAGAAQPPQSLAPPPPAKPATGN